MISTYISCEQRVGAEGPSFTFVIGVEDNTDIFNLWCLAFADLNEQCVVTVTIIVRVQMIMDRTPMRSSWEGSDEKVLE